MIFNLGVKCQSEIANDDILDSKENEKEENYRNDENESDLKDSSEDAQWDRHYHDRNKKWRFNDDDSADGEF